MPTIKSKTLLAVCALVIGCATTLSEPAFARNQTVRSRPNSQGGQTYYFNDHRSPIQCRPNSQGGQTCH